MNGKPNDAPLDWSKLDAMSDQGLAAMVESALFVLRRSEAVGAPSPAEMPNAVLTKQLEQVLMQRGVDARVAGNVVKQQAMARPVALALLGAIGSEPELALEVERIWRERGGLLFVGTGAILASALLLLVLKLKKVKVSKKDGAEIDFDKVSSGALGAILKFTGG